jgi:hypothetical protein
VYPRKRSSITFAPIAVALVSCAFQGPPVIALLEGAAEVRLIEREARQSLEGCEFMDRLVAHDGRMGAGRNNYRGSEERALQKLRNDMVQMNIDTAVVQSVLESITSSDSKGGLVQINAEGYRCG